MTPTNGSRNVLVVDDEPVVRSTIARMLRVAGISSTCVGLGSDALRSLETSEELGAILVDLNLPDIHGLDVLRAAHAARPTTPVVVMTGDASMNSAIEAMRSGAFDYLTKPLSVDGLVVAIEQAIAAGRVLRRDQSESRPAMGGTMIGKAPRFLKAISTLEAIAATNSSVLVLGERGTGKELAARAIHEHGSRRQSPFVSVNCGAFTESRLESELFGHVSGEFTGAVTSRRGLFEAATGGTIFLDEIGELQPTVQVRLLRVLQERKVRAVGASEERPTDVRVIAATHRDLAAMVEVGDFRRDLFFRLNVLSVRLPALRERKEDIPSLFAHFAAKHSRIAQREALVFDEQLHARLLEYDWPGNIRELADFVERCTGLAVDGRVPNDVFVFDERSRPESASSNIPFFEHSLPEALRAFQEQYLRELLRSCSGNLSEASRRSGVDRTNLKRILRRFGLLKADADD